MLAEPRLTCPIYATAQEAITYPCDVFFEYTKPEVAKANITAALQQGTHVVIGTSGLTDADYADIATLAEQHQCGVLAVGNFALTVVLLQKFAEMAAKLIPQWEIIDYVHDGKKDAPKGTFMKIAFIGGGSLQWTALLTIDLALNDTLAGASLVLHDIDASALGLMTRAAERITTQLGRDLQIEATTDRAEALRGADFVILCVAIGGLAAMRSDLDIPWRYGVAQSVGDTVGPGGLARGLRHIPFAVQVAREMEQLCPHAWLLNLTNPMTTICRAVTRATSIRAIGLCHEVGGVRLNLAKLFDVAPAAIEMSVGGINHLPALLHVTVDGVDSVPLLRAWLAEHGPFAWADQRTDDPLKDIFADRLAVKLTIFEQTGVLFGAGDRHVAEFFPNFLTESTDYGQRYGVLLTTIEQRQELLRQRRERTQQFVAGATTEPLERSGEQLAGVIAALAGGPAGRFVVNVPNQGQIDNLPRDAVVECMAEIGPLGLRPLAVGALPHPAYAAIAPHVARQELIVEAALTGRRAPALAALASDPLLRDPANVAPMLDELLAANAEAGVPLLT